MTTASEKLRRLGENNREDVALTTGGALLLFDALPQIVALVEAAEADLDYLSKKVAGTSFVMPETTLALFAALTALDEALS